MGYQYNFEKLEVWNDARHFVKAVYNITSNFPDNEKFGLILKSKEHQFQ